MSKSLRLNKCVKELNKWAEDHTNGLIKDLLPPGSVSSLTDSVYGNALYFKGAWEVPFAKSNTMDREFHRISGNSVSVPFMRSYERQYIEAYDGFKVLRIPYRQGGVDNNPIFPYRQGRVNNSRSFPYLQKLMLPITASLIDKALSVMLPVPVSLLDKVVIVPMSAYQCTFISQTRMMDWMIL
ncbi:serpin-Z2-like [Raphanus sativus]|uniref:Serpin-Z2-like n=1 Tax=Raphanus sativus TaxID=3726 RepID=A0A9W3DJZ7_RAPSA|nr:serpin-Z2-like [Raphanus sativus]